jgi:HK97 family phage major capsid protein
MAGFNDLITRSDVPIPTEEVGELLKVMPEESVLLKRARRQPMSTKTVKQTIMTTFPDAYWVDGDTGLKQTTKQSFSQPTMTAEELAVIAVVPDAVIDDSSLPIWATLRPFLAEAIGKKVDQAAIYGIDKPASWPLALVPGAIAAGVITPGNLTATPADQRKDAGQLVADLGLKMARDAGANLSGLIAQAGTGWELDRIRDADRRPIYDGVAGALRGVPFDELKNGAWSDVGTGDTAVPLIGVDWSQVYIGIRQDITVKMLDQAVISDAAGKVIFNLAQQDAKALRIVFRVGYQAVMPVNHQQTDAAKRFPAGVIRGALS